MKRDMNIRDRVGRRIILRRDITSRSAAGRVTHPAGAEMVVLAVRHGRFMVGRGVDKIEVERVDCLDAWLVEQRRAPRAAWREVFLGIEKLARARFTELAETAQRGGVRLLQPDGVVADTRKP